MTREDFIFTVGFDGEKAVVDKQSKKRYSKLSTKELMNEGLFKPALCSAIYSKDQKELDLVLEMYNSITAKKISNTDELKLVLGIQRIPEEITETVQI